MFCLKKNTHTHFKLFSNKSSSRSNKRNCLTLKIWLCATIEWKKAKQFTFSKNHLNCGSRYVFQYLLRKGNRACCLRCHYIVHVARLVYSSLCAQTNKPTTTTTKKRRKNIQKSVHRIVIFIDFLITHIEVIDVNVSFTLSLSSPSIYLSIHLSVSIGFASERINKIHCHSTHSY